MTLYSNLSRMVTILRIAAMREPEYDGRRDISPCCIGELIDKALSRETLIRVIFTRDSGYHSAGWWKNPDYERCEHLSLSFLDAETGSKMDQQKTLAAKVSRAFFGDHIDKLWIEPPYSDEGRARSVYHYRLFCDIGWNPILPRGEVYSTHLTEKGWKSFSELHGGASCIHHGEEIKG